MKRGVIMKISFILLYILISPQYYRTQLILCISRLEHAASDRPHPTGPPGCAGQTKLLSEQTKPLSLLSLRQKVQLRPA